MSICNKPSNKTAPETALEVLSHRARRNGWSWPPHPFQFVAWLLYLFYALVGFGVLVPLLPARWVPAGYTCPGLFFFYHLIVHLIAVSIDPADDSVRKTKYRGPLIRFSRSHHAHIIENKHCHICDVNVSSKTKHCGTCNKCVCGFDHHCVWLNNCVGERNYWLFLNSVVSAILGLLLILVISCYVFVEFFLNPTRLRTNQHFEGLTNKTNVWFVFLPAAPVQTQAFAILALAGAVILLGLLTVFLLCHLLVFHIYLMWNRMSTYEYIVKQRPVQAGKDPDKQSESCPSEARPIQEFQFYTGYTHPEIQMEDSSDLTPGKDLPKFCIRSDSSEDKLVLSPEIPELQDSDHQPQLKKKKKKRKRKLHKVPSMLEERSKSSPLPALHPELSAMTTASSASSSSTLHLPVSAALPKVALGSNGPASAPGPPADYHSESAESMDEIPVAQTRLGSTSPSTSPRSGIRRLPFPAVHFRRGSGKAPDADHFEIFRKCQSATSEPWKEEVELSCKVPAVFVSRSSGEMPASDSWPREASSEPPHRKCSSKRHIGDNQDSLTWDPSTNSTAG